ncbi:NPCBM/NEW2 domain-containing protein [Streptomyces sp. NPDC085929]|uniref:NPCBM/NEW2 domain-containing protein n=1 Tax=Streptomyces sp. NPDC085929 TaxID=3365739 RepID=UPI0037CD4BD0
MSTTGQKGRMLRRAAVAACAVLAATFTGTTTGVGTAAEPRPDVVYLIAAAPLDGSVVRGGAEVNGRAYPRSIVQRVGPADPVNQVEYHLGRHWKSFLATVGLRDDSPTGGTVSFEVSLDRTPVHRTELTVGQSRDIVVDIGGAFRMKLTVTGPGWQGGINYGAWGDARLTTS